MLVFSGSTVLIQNKEEKKKETNLNYEGILHLPAILWLRNWSFSRLWKLHWTKWFRYGNALRHFTVSTSRRPPRGTEQKFLYSFWIFNQCRASYNISLYFPLHLFFLCVNGQTRRITFFSPFPAKVNTSSCNPTPLMVFTYFHLTWVSRDSITIFPQYHKDLNHQKPIFPPKEAISVLPPSQLKSIHSSLPLWENICKPWWWIRSASLTKLKPIWSLTV